MSAELDRIVFCAKYFQRHAAIWTEVAHQLANVAQDLQNAPPHDEETWSWPDLANLYKEYIEFHNFLANDFVGKAQGQLNGLSEKLLEVMKTYILLEAENNAEIIQNVNKELGI